MQEALAAGCISLLWAPCGNSRPENKLHSDSKSNIQWKETLGQKLILDRCYTGLEEFIEISYCLHFSIEYPSSLWSKASSFYTSNRIWQLLWKSQECLETTIATVILTSFNCLMIDVILWIALFCSPALLSENGSLWVCVCLLKNLGKFGSLGGWGEKTLEGWLFKKQWTIFLFAKRN